jgi:hypothetical protein
MSRKHIRPWKKNIRMIPPAIRVKIADGAGPLIVATTKKIPADTIGQGLYDHLSIRLGAGGIEFRSQVIPPPDVGRYSARNVEGCYFTRTDLPKITKSFYMEAPNFGDRSKGSHTVVHDRLVYQREFREPRDIAISMELLGASEGVSQVYLMKFTVEYVLDPHDPDFEDDLLFCLNLLQENVGAVDVYPSGTTKEDFVKTLTLDWEIFPPGSVDDIVRRFGKKMRSAKAGSDAVLRDRIETFSKLKPKAYIQGTAGFNSYIGAQFADDLVVFENVRYGNALYVLYENWESISRRSRIDLIRGTDADFDRIIHGPVWKEQLDAIIRSQLRRRDRRARAS